MHGPLHSAPATTSMHDRRPLLYMGISDVRLLLSFLAKSIGGVPYRSSGTVTMTGIQARKIGTSTSLPGDESSLRTVPTNAPPLSFGVDQSTKVTC